MERCLAQGLSLEQIGERVGRHPSTVGYHVKKHGLLAVNHERHAPKGPIVEEALQRLTTEGASLREMADELGRSVSTVRYWLRVYGIGRTAGSRRRKAAVEARKAGKRYAMLDCRQHGVTRFVLENRGSYRCMQCRQERVTEWRRHVKRRLVDTAGGACVVCGYDRCVSALQFHHLDPAQKSFALSRQGVTRSFAAAQAEARKCVLLCSNCHAEVEAGLVEVPSANLPPTD